MPYIFDIYKNYNLIKAYKKSKISHETDGIHVYYYGPLVSAGFRTKIKTMVGTLYKITIKAQLIRGDMAYIYCESLNPKRRLISRDVDEYLITS